MFREKLANSRRIRDITIRESKHFLWVAIGVRIAFKRHAVSRKKPMLKIGRSGNGRDAVFRLSGRIEMEDVAELQRLFALEEFERHLVLDLKDVTLVDRDAVEFLARCEADSIKLENCPAYIREWLGSEKNAGHGTH